MELIIRTQDRRALITCKVDLHIEKYEIDSDYKLVGYTRNNEDRYSLGRFKTEAAAIEELDKIQFAINWGHDDAPVIEISEDCSEEE